LIAGWQTLLIVFALFSLLGYHRPCRRRQAHACRPKDIAKTVAFALQFSGRKRVHDADVFMSSIAAQRIMALDRRGFVVLKRPPDGGSVSRNAPANHREPE
jgi:hypothetical protein